MLFFIKNYLNKLRIKNFIMKKIFYLVATAFLLFAIYGAANLSLNDFNGMVSCPKIAGIPACYLVLLFFILGAVSHFVKSKYSNKAFYFFIGTPGVLALFASIKELSIAHTCPRTSTGVPMCFISLGLCSVILLFKFLSLRKSK